MYHVLSLTIKTECIKTIWRYLVGIKILSIRYLHLFKDSQATKTAGVGSPGSCGKKENQDNLLKNVGKAEILEIWSYLWRLSLAYQTSFVFF